MGLLDTVYGSVICPQISYVNPFIGSGGWAYGYGSLNPSAQVPYAALRLGADTTDSIIDLSYRHFSGYNYDDNFVRAISHTHLVGAGANDLGNVGIMPVRLDDDHKWYDQKIDHVLNLEHFGFNTTTKKDNNNKEEQNSLTSHGPLFWWATMNKTLESAGPGKYSTYLIEPDINIDLLGLGTHAAMHHYTFNSGNNDQALVVDACHLAKLEFPSSSACLNASLTIHEDGSSFTAHVHFDGSLSHGYLQVYLHGKISISSSSSTDLDSDGAVNSWLGCSHSFDEHSSGCSTLEDEESLTGVGIVFGVAQLNMVDGVDSVDVLVGLSFINASLASDNLDVALSNIGSSGGDITKEEGDYEAYSSYVDEVWCAALSLVGEDFASIDGDDDMNMLFHTAVYRTFLSPTVYSEPGSVSGAYIGLDDVVHSSETDAEALDGCSNDEEMEEDINSQRKKSLMGDDDVSWVDSWREASQYFATQHFSDMSLWDTFRSMNPFLLFVQKPVALGVLRSMATMTEQQGAFPHWPIGSHDSGCMYGTHGAALVLDSLLVSTPSSNSGGCGSWEESAVSIAVAVQAQLLAMATTSDTPNGRDDLQHYLDNGFVSLESTDKSATYTLAYAYDDFVLGAISSKLESLNVSVIEHQETMDAIARGSNFANVWSQDNLYFCPRSNNGTDGNGELICPLDPAAPLIDKKWYQEGDAYHYAYYAFQDIPGLIDLYDSPEQFDATLLNIFVQSLDHPFGEPIPNSYYWAGNEHDVLYPWFFNFGPNCTHTQEWTRKLTHLHYNISPRGIPGNDDYGAMSSWLVWASIGLHPLPGNVKFFIGSPRVSKATIYLTQLFQNQNNDDNNDGSMKLQIVTYNNSDVNVFVKELYVNGVAVTSPFIERGDIEQGALVEFYMTSDPSECSLC